MNDETGESDDGSTRPAPGPDHLRGESYPDAMVREVTTARGDRIRIRPIRPSDDVGLAAFHNGLSDRSVYRRFFFVHPVLSAPEIEHFTHVDYTGRLALVAEHRGGIVAVGRYERTPGTSEAEVAFVVSDEYQHHGIGTVLLEQLVDAALTRGITVFTAQTLAENHAMLAMFLKSGFPVTTTTESETVSVRFPIEPTAHQAPR